MLLWMEGFDTYALANGAIANTDLTSVGGYTQINASGWTGNYITAWGSSAGFTKIFDNPMTTFGLGFMLKVGTIPATGNVIMQFKDSAGTAQGSLTIEADGSLAYRFGPSVSGTILAQTPAGTLPASGWFHVETKIVVNNTTGSVEIRVDEASAASVSGIDTQYTGNTNIQQITASYGTTTAASTGFDDMFAWDGTGSINNDFLGYCRVRTSFPEANGASQDFVPNTGNAWDAINDTSPDSDTTYIASSTVGDVSTFDTPDLPASTVSVKGIRTTMVASKSDAGACSVAHGLKSASSNSMGADHSLATTYSGSFDMHETDPDTSAAWTIAAVNAAQLRLERTA